MAALQQPRESASMATLGNEVVLFGGDGFGTGFTSDTRTFDGSSWTQALGSSAPARESASMATLGSEVVLFGGNGLISNFLNDTWTFDGTNWTQVTVTNPPPARAFGAMATLP